MLVAEKIGGSEPEAGEAVPEIPVRCFGTSGMEKISSAIVIHDDEIEHESAKKEDQFEELTRWSRGWGEIEEEMEELRAEEELGVRRGLNIELWRDSRDDGRIEQ